MTIIPKVHPKNGDKIEISQQNRGGNFEFNSYSLYFPKGKRIYNSWGQRKVLALLCFNYTPAAMGAGGVKKLISFNFNDANGWILME